MFRFILHIALYFLSITHVFTQNSPTIVKIETAFGTMRFQLYEKTPLHKANFIKLIENHHYDSLLFHRVIKDFVIQGGDPKSKLATKDSLLGEGDVGYTVPAEINSAYYHKKGVLGMAREDEKINPLKASSGCQFYIVHGKLRNDTDLIKAHYRINKKLIQVYEDSIKKTDSLRFNAMNAYDKHLLLTNLVKNKTNYYTINSEQEKIYRTIGGTPHLDNHYTVFGEMVDGFDVLDQLAAEKTDKNDRPVSDLRIKITIVENTKDARKNRKNIK